MTDEAVSYRGEKGRFLARPPNAGRKVGSSQSDLLRKLIEPHRQALIDRAFEIAKGEDPFAAAAGLRILLERLAPVPKQESEKFEIEGLAEAATFAEKCDCVIRAVGAGECSAEYGERCLRMLDIYRRAHETDDLAKRIAALESGRAPVTIENGCDLV